MRAIVEEKVDGVWYRTFYDTRPYSFYEEEGEFIIEKSSRPLFVTKNRAEAMAKWKEMNIS